MTESAESSDEKSYADEALRIKAMAAHATSRGIRAELLLISKLYEKLSLLAAEHGVKSFANPMNPRFGMIGDIGDLSEHADA
ncbi:MAG TPA: hypothetical protein VGD54_19075 [Steroidobacteraceae bacterium]